MKTSSVSELKKELNELPPKQLVELCMQLTKFKKENKEFLDYLLFNAHDINHFTLLVKGEIDAYFDDINLNLNLYLIKKSLRKITRLIVKYCKYNQNNAFAIELHIYFCVKLKNSQIDFSQSQAIVNMYAQQLKKISTLITKLHPDLQADYLVEIDEL